VTPGSPISTIKRIDEYLWNTSESNQLVLTKEISHKQREKLKWKYFFTPPIDAYCM